VFDVGELVRDLGNVRAKKLLTQAPQRDHAVRLQQLKLFPEEREVYLEVRGQAVAGCARATADLDQVGQVSVPKSRCHEAVIEGATPRIRPRPWVRRGLVTYEENASITHKSLNGRLGWKPPPAWLGVDVCCEVEQ